MIDGLLHRPGRELLAPDIVALLCPAGTEVVRRGSSCSIPIALRFPELAQNLQVS